MVQRQAPINPLLLKAGCLHIMELPLPFQLASNHQVPDVEILKLLTLLLSTGLDFT